MSIIKQRLMDFAAYARKLDGYEKGEAQLFCDRFFRAFGHRGLEDIGAKLEFQVKVAGNTKFADLVWKDRVLIEMKKRGEDLEKHYRQAFEYWINLVPHRPRYVILCNFDEFWVYDFDQQIDTPMDRITLNDLPNRYTAFNFLLPQPVAPQFMDNLVEVTREAASKVSTIYNNLVSRGESQNRAQLFMLQCVFSMFAEDFDLLPRGFFTALLRECVEGGSAYDLVGGLFRQMNEQEPARGGRFQEIKYFDGGLFLHTDPVELDKTEANDLYHAALEDWSRVQPPIFGTLFESSMGVDARHAFGAHFTSEADIQKVVLPSIVRPWRRRINEAKSLTDLLRLRSELTQYRVLDPACGSGNFLYVAFREMKRLEMEILWRIFEEHGSAALKNAGALSLVSERQFFGIDTNSFAVELARITLVLGKELALAEFEERFGECGVELQDLYEASLPLSNLSSNIVRADALFAEWPEADAIIGNPPFQSKNKMQQELGPEYVARVRERYPDVPGRADYCVYWFRRAHDELRDGCRAGLVGTNTIRQNYSREGGLDYIVDNGGTIVEAVSTQVWSGQAAVHVSIVNWVKGEYDGEKLLLTQEGDTTDSLWEQYRLQKINSSLSARVDVSGASRLTANTETKYCFQGQTHGNEHFLLTRNQRSGLLKTAPEEAEVVFPFMTANDMFSTNPPAAKRYVIDFQPRDVLEAAVFKHTFKQVKEKVLPVREKAAREEEERNKGALERNPRARVNRHHRNFFKKWWLLSYPREEMVERIGTVPRYVACARITKRPIFVFLSSSIRPNDVVQAFPFPDDYSFGILQSMVHWEWFTAKCSTLKGDFRYTSNSVFDTFPWPQAPTVAQVRAVADAAIQLRQFRTKTMERQGWTLRDLYRSLDLPGANPLKDRHQALDGAVKAAYGMPAEADVLEFLLALNLEVAEREATAVPVIGPGLPPYIANPDEYITEDCIRMNY